MLLLSSHRPTSSRPTSGRKDKDVAASSEDDKVQSASPTNRVYDGKKQRLKSDFSIKSRHFSKGSNDEVKLGEELTVTKRSHLRSWDIFQSSSN